jgi:hypothetical protein
MACLNQKRAVRLAKWPTTMNERTNDMDTPTNIFSHCWQGYRSSPRGSAVGCCFRACGNLPTEFCY